MKDLSETISMRNKKPRMRGLVVFRESNVLIVLQSLSLLSCLFRSLRMTPDVLL